MGAVSLSELSSRFRRTPSALLAVLGALALVLGVTPSPARAAPCTDTEPIALHYCELGGSASFLGAPVGTQYAVGAGRGQHYTSGAIFWSAASGAHEVHGAVVAQYRALGGPLGFLGFPLTDEVAAGDGLGRLNQFQLGTILWSPATGAHEVHGAIRGEWTAVGGVTGLLGYPTSDELRSTDGVGRYNTFQRGVVYFSPATGAHEVHGAILAKWRALGAERGFLGYPVQDEIVLRDGVGAASGFQHGTIEWSPATGAHELHGAIRSAWADLTSESDFLGYPTSDELGSPDGVGRYNTFQHGVIYFSPATGAHEVHGAILAEWGALGAERGLLGYPTGNETWTSDGIGRYNTFQRGVVYFSPATGAHEVHGAILARWTALGRESSALGYPITDEYAVNGGRQSDFQGGFLRWTAGTGALRTAVIGPYQRAGAWVTRFAWSREYGGATPVTAPAQVDVMAAAGVHTLYLQAASDDPRYPGVLSPDLLGQFLTRAHAHGMQVVAWYLPHFTDVNADLGRMRAMADFRSGGQAFDALAVDIEDKTVADVTARNAALVDFSTRLAAALPGVTLGAIVVPPVVTDVLSNPPYWPNFPWHQLSGLYQVWLPMAYWSNRTDAVYSDPYRYTSENISRTRADLGEQCAAVSVIGGYGAAETAADYAAMARAGAEQGAIGVSIFDWATTPASVWSSVSGYDQRGC